MSHFIEIIKLDTEVKREFYTTMCINEFWSVRTLRERINSALFERTAISKKPEQTIINDLQFVIELKLDKFRPEYKGQVELYLKWLDKYEKAKMQLEQRENKEE